MKNIGKNKIFIISLIILVFASLTLFLVLSKKDKEWVLNNGVVSKGNKSYKIGDYYDYDETNNGKITGLTDVKWKVLGALDGKLLIMSASNVDTLTLGDKSNLEKSQTDYLEATNKLNEIAKLYGKGKGALNSRSINAEDVDKLTGYKKEDFDDYNKEYTYYWSSELNPVYEKANSERTSLTLNHNNQFIWYDKDNNKWEKSTKPDTDLSDKSLKIATIKNTFYAYDNKGYNSENYLLEPDSLAYKMLYLDDSNNNANYWVNDPFIYLHISFVGFGYRIIKSDSLNYTYIVYSSGNTRETTAGVRVVVEIE